MDTTRTQQWTWIIGTALGVIIIICIGWLIARHRAGSPVIGGMTEATSTPEQKEVVSTKGAVVVTESTPTKAESGASVTVADQTAGNTVMVTSAALPQRGWVAIRDGNDWTLGAERIEAGTSSTTVTLLRNTVAGKAYKAVLYLDNGNGAFDLHGDTLVVGADGMPVSVSFLAK